VTPMAGESTSGIALRELDPRDRAAGHNEKGT
jgi:hypothetical protein